MKSSPVRDLARRYAAGELSQENYRNQRRALISAITSGNQSLTYRDDNPEGAVRPGQVKLLAMAAAAVVVLAVVFIVAWKEADKGHVASTAADTGVTAAAVPLPTPGPTLVRGFVENNDWADSSIEDFIRDWHKLTADDQQKARGSMLYPRLESELREQIASERAMISATGGSKGDPHLVLLQRMAETLGVTDAR